MIRFFVLVLSIALTFSVNAEEPFSDLGQCNYSSEKEPVKTAIDFLSGKNTDRESHFVAYSYCQVCHKFYNCLEKLDGLTNKSKFNYKILRENLTKLCLHHNLPWPLSWGDSSCKEYLNEVARKKKEIDQTAKESEENEEPESTNPKETIHAKIKSYSIVISKNGEWLLRYLNRKKEPVSTPIRKIKSNSLSATREQVKKYAKKREIGKTIDTLTGYIFGIDLDCKK